MIGTLDELLKSLINHKVGITFTQHEEGSLRDTFGVLKDFDKNFIHIELFDDYGERESDYYLNRCACTLHSIIDYGEKK